MLANLSAFSSSDSEQSPFLKRPNSTRRLLSALTALGLTCSAALAGGTLTSGNASFQMVGVPVFSSNLGDCNFLTDTSAPDQAYKYTWYYRTQFNTVNRYMSSLDTPVESYAGDTSTITYTNAGPGPAGQERFDAQIRTVLTDGASPDQSRVVGTCRFTSRATTTLTYQVFCVIDLDLSGGGANPGVDDAIVFDPSTGIAQQTEGSTSNFARIQAINPTRWQAGTGTAIRALLNGGPADLTNASGPITTQDVAMAFQWTLVLSPNQETTLTAAFAVNQPALCQAPSVSQSPASATVCATGSTAFSVVAADATSYAWQIQTAPGVWQTLGNDPGPLPCGGGAFAFAAPVNSPNVTLGIRPCPSATPGAPQRFQIRAVATNPCGSVTSNEATYTICPADFNCSGSVSVQDIFDFITAYFGGDPRADINASGAVSVQDIFDYLGAYFAGCS